MSKTYTGTLTVKTPTIFNTINLPRGEYEVKITAYEGGEVGFAVTKCPNGVPHVSVEVGLVMARNTQWTPTLPKVVKNKIIGKK